MDLVPLNIKTLSIAYAFLVSYAHFQSNVRVILAELAILIQCQAQRGNLVNPHNLSHLSYIKIKSPLVDVEWSEFDLIDGYLNVDSWHSLLICI